MSIKYDKQGREIPDKSEVEVPLRFRRNLAERDRIRSIVETVISQRAAADGYESFEESQDFYCEEDECPPSEHEYTEEMEQEELESLRVLRENAQRVPEKGDRDVEEVGVDPGSEEGPGESTAGAGKSGSSGSESAPDGGAKRKPAGPDRRQA